jgi:16S rRNA processing protein RimM
VASAPATEPYDVLIGVIVAAHGVRGELRVAPETDFPERFARLGPVWVAPKTGPPRLMKITAARAHSGKGLVLLRLEGIADREAVESLRGAALFIRESDLTALPEGQYYEFQILGLQVFTEQGRDLGPILDIIHTGANDVYETPQAMIPAIPSILRQVDLEGRRVVVHWGEGLEK